MNVNYAAVSFDGGKPWYTYSLLPPAIAKQSSLGCQEHNKAFLLKSIRFTSGVSCFLSLRAPVRRSDLFCRGFLRMP